MNTESQNARILQHLQAGNRLTPLEALGLFGCFRLSARCWELRDKGYPVRTEKKKVMGKVFAEYSLEQ